VGPLSFFLLSFFLGMRKMQAAINPAVLRFFVALGATDQYSVQVNTAR
jgi:hypothetical protein